MAQATISARIDEKDKQAFDNFCSDVGLNTSAAINLFIKAVLRERRIPFEISQSSDPFYSESNQKHYWQTQDKKTLKRINQLIKDIERNGCLEGIGQPEALKNNLHGEYSRRINEKDRLVYHVENDRIYIVSCRGHYDDK